MNIELGYTIPQLEIINSIESKNHRFIAITKGRRFGLTHGMMHACIEWALEGQKILWGDTISTNIDRYWERYALPALKQNGIDYKYDSRQKKALIGQGFIDFRSADRPENWEGFGYNKIFLNEAGIILKNDYLYTNAVLPMLIDYPNSCLIAGGVPKGKLKKDGSEHKFYTIWKSCENKEPGYKGFTYSSYDNPKLSKDDIEALEHEINRMSPAMKEQEIYGQFVDGVGGTLWSPELIQHVDFIPEFKRIIIGVDPSVTSKEESDETGIIVAGQAYNKKIYILADRTGKYTPNQWANIVVNEYKKWNANIIVAEVNQGGDMVESILRSVDSFIQVKKIHAFKGKDLRAEPVVGLYEQGKVLHARGLHALENEQLTWVPGIGKSPNRIDAMVYAVTEFSQKKINTNVWH
jgi:hypothetical protein